MTLTPVWRTRIFAAGAAVVAVWLGGSIANQELALATLLVGALAAMILMAAQPVPLDALLLGAAIFGYVVGNRGFAQLYLANSFPLLPAELVLLVGGALLIVRSARHQVLPIRKDALNIAILAWVALSSVRLYADVKAFGFMALRDYAMVYYAAFFFLGQHAGANPRSRRFLERCLLLGCIALVIILPVFLRFPEVFFGPLSFRGLPLIYFKGDLAGTFLAVGSVLFYLGYETRRSWAALLASLVLAAGTIMTNNRASLLALFVATVLLVLGRRWRFAALQAVAAVTAAVVILFVAYVRDVSWRETPLFGVYERIASIGDPLGQRTYSADTAADKGDNNVFRMVWWQTVFEDTVATAPVTGLGYGYDLAEKFVHEYYPDADDDFTTRSPHNILLTVFARTGLIGLLPFLGVLVVLFVRAVRACRHEPAGSGAWLSVAIIFVSACFGVVLEGPMGAVVFWTMLGLANAGPTSSAADPGREDAVQPEPLAATKP